ncbi:MAG: cyclopropane-fatty-acyl-phospholipid synthase family protein, partial [Gammaproteobacteria bacterium]|nr:cyclopropane-fatty-acyl-phospholipid synthase family protein [Gammaproteobacteria bacterium]
MELWNGERVDVSTSRPQYIVRIKSPSSLLRLVRRPSYQFLDLLADTEIEVDGDLQDLIVLLLTQKRRLFHNSRVGKLTQAARASLSSYIFNNTKSSRRNSDVHYDLGNKFYSQWLGNNSIYTGARFENSEMELAAAQEYKLDTICRKLDLRNGHRLLDIGCGWGGFVIKAAKDYQAKGHGISLSVPQVRYARSRARELKIDHMASFEVKDYRHLAATHEFDRVVCIGMLEHVGKAYLPSFAKALRQSLTDSGVGVLQFVTSRDDGLSNPWIERNIFPGVYMPPIRELVSELENAGFQIRQVEDLGAHYALTLEKWNARFQEIRSNVSREFGERFARVWELYLIS